MKIKKVIIPVAGFGTRFLPATKAQQKEMLPIIDKPVLQFVVEEAVSGGVEDVIFITGRNEMVIENHFEPSSELENLLLQDGKKEMLEEVKKISKLANFSYINHKGVRGDGGAILCAKHLVENEKAVAVLFGDDVVEAEVSCMKQMQEVYEKTGSIVVALDEVPPSEVFRYGVVKAKDIGDGLFEIEDIVEKPKIEDAPSNMTLCGKYIITPEVFEELEKLAQKAGGKEVRLSEAIKNVIGKTKVYGFRFKGKRYDCGSKIGFLKATVDFALKHGEVADEFKEYLKLKSKEL
jgi:UTP--glucose-1-phosphate uridylyltransferase